MTQSLSDFFMAQSAEEMGAVFPGSVSVVPEPLVIAEQHWMR
jgi:hypothetical protein